MLLQQGVPTQFTFTIGWVDLVIMVILIVFFSAAEPFSLPSCCSSRPYTSSGYFPTSFCGSSRRSINSTVRPPS